MKKPIVRYMTVGQPVIIGAKPKTPVVEEEPAITKPVEEKPASTEKTQEVKDTDKTTENKVEETPKKQSFMDQVKSFFGRLRFW